MKKERLSVLGEDKEVKIQKTFVSVIVPCCLRQVIITVMCLSIGTPKIMNFPFVPNGKFITFRCPKILAHYRPITMC